MSLGQNIKKLRELRQLNLEQMATNLNISTEQYEQIELEESEPSLSQLREIADILKVHPADLLKSNENTVSFHGEHSQQINYQAEVTITNFAYNLSDKEAVELVQNRCYERIEELSILIAKQSEEMQKVIELLQKTMSQH